MAEAHLGALDPVTEQELMSPAVKLGQSLFWDIRLSSDGNTACASCHYRENHGSDRRTHSITARGEATTFHSLSVFNAQLAEAGLRWFADRPSGADQAIGSITGSMGFEERAHILPLLEEHGYTPLFQEAFPDDATPLSAANYGTALEAYQLTLRTPAPFDDWLKGDDDALNEEQKSGLRRFLTMGCAGCHNGALLGGNSLQRFGMLEDYWDHTGTEEPHSGLMNRTGKEEDRYRFRVAPLRNVAKTPPYFHDGSVAELEKAIAIMARIQLGQPLEQEALEELAAFLGTLTGKIPANFAAPEKIPFHLPEGAKE